MSFWSRAGLKVAEVPSRTKRRGHLHWIAALLAMLLLGTFVAMIRSGGSTFAPPLRPWESGNQVSAGGGPPPSPSSEPAVDEASYEMNPLKTTQGDDGTVRSNPSPKGPDARRETSRSHNPSEPSSRCSFVSRSASSPSSTASNAPARAAHGQAMARPARATLTPMTWLTVPTSASAWRRGAVAAEQDAAR